MAILSKQTRTVLFSCLRSAELFTRLVAALLHKADEHVRAVQALRLLQDTNNNSNKTLNNKLNKSEKNELAAKYPRDLNVQTISLSELSDALDDGLIT